MLEFYLFLAPDAQGNWFCFIPNDDGRRLLTETYGLTSKFDPFTQTESYWRDMFEQAEAKGIIPSENKFAPYEMQEQRCILRAEAIGHTAKLNAHQYRTFMRSVYQMLTYVVTGSAQMTISQNEASYTGKDKTKEGFAFPEAVDTWSMEAILPEQQGFSYTELASDYVRAFQGFVKDKELKRQPMTSFDRQVQELGELM